MHFLPLWCFELIRPVQKLLPCYSRILHIPALNPVEKDSNWGREIVQLDRNLKFSGSNPQCVSLRSSPSAPFNDYDEAESEELLTELPLQSLDFFAACFIPQIESEGIHPFVGTKTNRAELSLELRGIRCLTATHIR